MNYALNKSNKLKHAKKNLDAEDERILCKTFAEVGIKPL